MDDLTGVKEKAAKEQRRIVATHRRTRERQRIAALDAYGFQCACCGTSEDVSVCPTDGRTKVEVCGTTRSGGFNRWLAQNDYPGGGFETRCHICHLYLRGGLCKCDVAQSRERAGVATA